MRAAVARMDQAERGARFADGILTRALGERSARRSERSRTMANVVPFPKTDVRLGHEGELLAQSLVEMSRLHRALRSHEDTAVLVLAALRDAPRSPQSDKAVLLLSGMMLSGPDDAA